MIPSTPGGPGKPRPGKPAEDIITGGLCNVWIGNVHVVVVLERVLWMKVNLMAQARGTLHSRLRDTLYYTVTVN